MVVLFPAHSGTLIRSMLSGNSCEHDNKSAKKKPLETKGSESSSPVVGGVSDEGRWTRLLVPCTNTLNNSTQSRTTRGLLTTG